ncbi:FAD binding domain-containing protein [Polaromonas sp. YR568]|uniref:FAD binding domain-containing protein n=1 Tax=Polaromonas sp. YR568 TaxID=1855301 RepID=UPI003138107A
MKPAAFDYLRADHADVAVAALTQYGEDARILAGGQSLMAVLNMRLAQPSLLVDISRSESMAQIRIAQGQLCIGAAATQASVEWRQGLANELPLLTLAFPHISHFQVRNRGTVVGSIAHADPSAELPLCLLALEGEVVLRRDRSRRVVKAVDFFTGMLLTARQPDELLEEVRFPLAHSGTGYGFEEFSMRHGDFAVCAVAVVADTRRLRIAVGGVADRPTARDFPVLQGSALDDALNELAWSLEARDEPQASALLRRQLVRTLGRRAVYQALANRIPERSTA